MAIINKLKTACAEAKMRNQPCPCGSGLKTKKCHGSEDKRKKANAVANLSMAIMIHYDRQRAGLESEEECDAFVGKLMEVMYNILDPDYVEPVKPNQGVQPEPDTQPEPGEDHVEKENVKPEPEVTGNEKIESIRESAGVDRCPKCLGVKMVNENICYKCKKGK